MRKTNYDDTKLLNGILNQQMKTLRAYRNSLIHECVTGRRRITEADVARIKANDNIEQ